MALDLVVPTFGRPKDLEALLAKVRAQTRRPDRILVVDDTPGDEVKAVVEAHPEAEYHRNPGPRAIPTARNHGIALGTADLVLFLDNDVRIEPTYIERMVAALRADPGAIAAMGHVTNLDPMGKGKRAIANVFGLNHRTPRECRLLPNLNTTYPMAMPATTRVDWLWGCNMLVRREAFAQVRFETQFVRYSLYEDIEFSVHLQKAFPGRHLLMVHDARLQDARSDDARLGVADVMRMRTINRLYVMHKHGRVPPAAVARLLWTDVGSLMVTLANKPRDVPAGVRGLARGWGAVARHRKELRAGDLSRLNQGYSWVKP